MTRRVFVYDARPRPEFAPRSSKPQTQNTQCGTARSLSPPPRNDQRRCELAQELLLRLGWQEMYKNDDLPGGHVIALGPGNEDAALRALRAYPGGLQMGGGITPQNASRRGRARTASAMF